MSDPIVPGEYRAPRGTIVSCVRRGDVTTTVIDADRLHSEPFAPAALWTIKKPAIEVFQLHKAIGKRDLRLTFETYDTTVPPPISGVNYTYQCWWTDSQVAAVLDTTAVWILEPFPDDGDHDHCLLTWEHIAAYADCNEAYHSHLGWIAPEAFESYVQRDILRFRSGIKPI